MRLRLLALLVLALAGCVAGAPPAWVGAAYAPPAGRPAPSVDTLASLGRAMFFDASLSASGKTACASCHDPRFAFGPPNALSVQLGGRDGATPGTRAAPSLRYLQTLPPFSEHHFDNDGDDSIDAGPTGGHTWDGRAGSAHEQARLPLLSPGEMANATPAEFVARLQRSAQADGFRRAFGPRIFDDGDAAFAAALMAFEVFQQSPRDFYPYSSRYDAVLRGQAVLSTQEARGLQVFNDPAKGNCAACHLSAATADGAFPLFTDFGLIALGVPRHPERPANADLGLCGPLRTDFTGRDDYCGRFRTPTLRNVAVRQSFFHNGVFHTLREAVAFYARRDTEPERFYARGTKFDDLPPRYHANVNTEPPFGGRPGGPPAFSDDDIDDLIAFLRTLTDADIAHPP